MDTRSRSHQLVAGLAAFMWVAAPLAEAQENDWCCFTNRRFSGVCTVVPAPGESCHSVLSYLNNLSSAGKTYCGSTAIRLGWRSTRCEDAVSGSSGVFMEERQIHQPAPMEAMPATSVYPPSVPVTIAPGSVLSVSMDGPLDLSEPGASFTASLDADLVFGGSVVAPKGSSVHGRVTTSEWGPAQPMLELTSLQVGDAQDPVPIACSDSGGPVGAVMPSLGVRLATDGATLESGEQVTFGPAIPLLSTPEAVAMTRASIGAQRQAIIAANLTLTDQESIYFWPVYREYRVEMETVDDRFLNLISSYASSWGSLTDEQARILLDEALAIEEAALAVRKKHLSRLHEVLPAKKVARFFQVESRLDTAIDAEIADGIPLIR